MAGFAKRFLAVYAPQLYRHERLLDQIHEYFDPEVCPSGFLDYLASWIDLELDRNWPDEKQRLLLLNAMRLYRTRGTSEGIATFVEIYTGYRPEIIEHCYSGMQIGTRSKIGVNTKLYRGARKELFRFTVLLRVGSVAGFDRDEIHRIVRIQKPAWARYYLVVMPDQFMQLEVRSTIGVDTLLG